jgi:hypothetical protein
MNDAPNRRQPVLPTSFGIPKVDSNGTLSVENELDADFFKRLLKVAQGSFVHDAFSAFEVLNRPAGDPGFFSQCVLGPIKPSPGRSHLLPCHHSHFC